MVRKTVSRHDRDGTRLGQLPRLYNFFLNPYVDMRFTAACPGCCGKTKQRKLPLAIFIENWGMVVQNKWEWLQSVAKNNIVDLALARWLSREFQTSCLAVSAYAWADTYAYRFYENGEMTSEFDREMEERPSYRIDAFLESIFIGYNIRDYKECEGPGWCEVVVNPFADVS